MEEWSGSLSLTKQVEVRSFALKWTLMLPGPDVHCKCIDPGLVLSRANLTFRDADGNLIRGQNANLSVISAKVLSF